MVAFLTGVTRSPFTSAVLVLEMTDRHNVIFFLMLSGIAASLVSLLACFNAKSNRYLFGYCKIPYLYSIRFAINLYLKSGEYFGE